MLTKKEKKEREKIRKKLIEDGILPIPQPKTNYKQYLKKTDKMIEALNADITGDFEIIQALMLFYPTIAPNRKVYHFSAESKFAMKVIHLAYESMCFKERCRELGRESCRPDEWYEEVYYKVFPKAEYKNQGEDKDD